MTPFHVIRPSFLSSHTIRFVVLSPCAFIAANYMLLGRLARQLEKGHFLLVSPQRLTKVFLTSDITTFLIQAAGGGISSSKTQSSANLGSHVCPIPSSFQPFLAAPKRWIDSIFFSFH